MISCYHNADIYGYTYKYLYIQIQIHMLGMFRINTCICFLCQLKGPRNDTLVARKMLRVQILAPNTILQWKEPKLLEEVAESRTGTGTIMIWASLKNLVPESNEIFRKLDNVKNISKGQKTLNKRVPYCQSGTIWATHKIKHYLIKTSSTKLISMNPHWYKNNE